MRREMRYRGRDFSGEDIAWIRRLIAERPDACRLELSRIVSERLDWRMPDGRLKDAACRGAMLSMERDGLIRLPARKHVHHAWKREPIERTLWGEPGAPIEGSVSDLNAVGLDLVRGHVESALFNELLDRYHYLGFRRQAGAQMRYLVRASGGSLLGCLGWGMAAWKVNPRDEFIGWSAEQREKRLHLVVGNSRFLILPWVRVRHLASKILGLAARQLPRDWRARYGYRPALLETFVDRSRFRGTCYRAAGWRYVGDTTGRGRDDVRHEAHGRSVKAIWVHPLHDRFREDLGSA
jgi:hypothetical protein